MSDKTGSTPADGYHDSGVDEGYHDSGAEDDAAPADGYHDSGVDDTGKADSTPADNADGA
ncbi:hypothetical protein [Phytomonospora endophytica]|uniref:Uncharacterized protein n=1 Tax=Phytomonospora endophytica TaxID=714109 RepID=A0A841FPQ1_9ACTN|nr:hypothetical protein [Phytomonospora endophytica]MBB6039281.1 hypothetical protein [Phytomonospora endophytica]GIG69776.1 hypothetical protein Pen01_60710 [Phytomonospora endophytica]